MRARSIGALALAVVLLVAPSGRAQSLLDEAFTPHEPSQPEPTPLVERLDPGTLRELRGARVQVGSGLVLLGTGLFLGVLAWDASWNGSASWGTDFFTGMPEESLGPGPNQRRVAGFAVGGAIVGSIGLGIAIAGGSRCGRIRREASTTSARISSVQLTLGDGRGSPVSVRYSLRF